MTCQCPGQLVPPFRLCLEIFGVADVVDVSIHRSVVSTNCLRDCLVHDCSVSIQIPSCLEVGLEGEDASSIDGPSPERTEVAIPRGLVGWACATHPIRVDPLRCMAEAMCPKPSPDCKQLPNLFQQLTFNAVDDRDALVIV